MTQQSPTPDGAPRTVAGAIARGSALMLRDTLLNGGVLLSLIVGVGGVLTGTQPWVWLGPVIGVVGVVVSFAGHRERAVTGADGSPSRRTIWPTPAVWTVAVAVPVLALLAMVLMWSARG